jgi:hypothetical protein
MAESGDHNALGHQGAVSSRNRRILMQGESPGATSSFYREVCFFVTDLSDGGRCGEEGAEGHLLAPGLASYRHPG